MALRAVAPLCDLPPRNAGTSQVRAHSRDLAVVCAGGSAQVSAVDAERAGAVVPRHPPHNTGTAGTLQVRARVTQPALINRVGAPLPRRPPAPRRENTRHNNASAGCARDGKILWEWCCLRGVFRVVCEFPGGVLVRVGV